MNTVTIDELEWLLEREAVDLVDVRPKQAFRNVHAYGARSVPLSRLAPRSLGAHRRGSESVPLCLMCDRTMCASLAAGLIAGVGLASPRVLKGGLEAWKKQGLPVVEYSASQRFFRSLAHLSDCLRSAIAFFWQRLRLHPA
jgi:rhodanese-related sulfurtransferase